MFRCSLPIGRNLWRTPPAKMYKRKHSCTWLFWTLKSHFYWHLEILSPCVMDSTALPMTSGHVSNTPCKSCDLSFVVLSLELLYAQWVLHVLISNRCETSRFKPLNPAKCPIDLPPHTPCPNHFGLAVPLYTTKARPFFCCQVWYQLALVLAPQKSRHWCQAFHLVQVHLDFDTTVPKYDQHGTKHLLCHADYLVCVEEY